MTRYHANPETGETGICRARIKCDFALSEEQHATTRAGARAIYEKMRGNSFASPGKVVRKSFENSFEKDAENSFDNNSESSFDSSEKTSSNFSAAKPPVKRNAAWENKISKVYRTGLLTGSNGGASESFVKLADSVRPEGRTARDEAIFSSPSLAGNVRWFAALAQSHNADLSVSEVKVDPDSTYIYNIDAWEDYSWGSSADNLDEGTTP